MVHADDAAHDSIRFGYTLGWANLRTVGDRVGLWAYEGKISADERAWVHDRLQKVFEALDRLFDESCDQVIEDNGSIYSDGSPTYSIVLPATQFPAGGFTSGDVAPSDCGAPGSEVIVEWPPHLRGDDMAGEW